MPWPIAAFTVLFIALALGFAWYERTRPPAKLVALVATLAALAALGRVAFAAVPNVKPTTDIVVIAGFVLGAAPGFAVGAVAALSSNLVFGEGPWTPWQMAAWGICGLLGAALGAASGRRMGRVPLAVACGGAGFLFGAILDASSWLMYTGTPRWDRYVAISGSSFGFNVAHSVGNVAFCLAFGPLLVRALERYRERAVVVWHPLPGGAGTAAGAVVAAVVLAGGLAGAPSADAASARDRAVHYLETAQNRDGGFGAAPHQASSPLYSAWAAIGLRAAGVAPTRVRHGGATLAARVALDARAVRGTGDIERTILALVASRGRPGRLPGLLVGRQDRDGSFDGLSNLTSFGVLALRAAGQPRGARSIRRATAWLARQQNPDGGFSFARRGSASGIDDTAAALEALVAARGPRGTPQGRALRYLLRHQGADGGFAAVPGHGSNAQSTAFAIQALVSAGRNPARVRHRGSRTPLGYLASLTTASGAVRYSRRSAQTPVWVTAQVLAALARRPLPVR